ncbi:hypothetical protein [Hyphomonas sp.]|uniref:hypothetical protein n=1 Tax=Hyphomonas sp. TaxID=87 RepID=UPI003565B789
MRHSHSICFATLLMSIAMLPACASKPAPAQTVTSAANVIARTGELPSQTLAPGACGLFLWTQSAPVRFVFFAEAGSDKAVMNIGGTQSPLELTASRGALFGQFMTQMTYRSPDGNVGLSFKPGELLDGGQRIEDGRLSLVSKDGWETMIPVLGLSACQPESR